MTNRELGKMMAAQIAAEICGVQPMSTNAISDLYKAASSREQLIDEGFRPASNLGLMWIKDGKDDSEESIRDLADDEDSLHGREV